MSNEESSFKDVSRLASLIDTLQNMVSKLDDAERVFIHITDSNSMISPYKIYYPKEDKVEREIIKKLLSSSLKSAIAEFQSATDGVKLWAEEQQND